MKRESVLEKLNSVKDGADPNEVLEWIMNENGSDINREKNTVSQVKSNNAGLQKKYDELKTQFDEINKSNMTAEELMKKAQEDYESKLNELNVQKNRVDAKKSLTDAGLTLEEADKLLDRFVTADEKATSDTVSALLDVLGSRKTAVEAATKQAMLQETPKPSANHSTDSSGSYQKAFEEASSRNDGVAMAAAIRNGFLQTASL